MQFALSCGQPILKDCKPEAQDWLKSRVCIMVYPTFYKKNYEFKLPIFLNQKIQISGFLQKKKKVPKALATLGPKLGGLQQHWSGDWMAELFAN